MERATLKLDPLRFAVGEKCHGVLVHERHVPQIEHGQTPGIVQLPEVSGIDENPGRTMLAPRVMEWRTNEGENAAHGIVYRTKTNLSGLSKNRVDCGSPDALLRQQ
jgi:hypothetical protein